ncbi:LacI family DNA-binding transcriptional regulator [Bailinhaonella thermotolerans]|nr:LacI family DNA-binding transcriptional regulator [Bailinhaonella thermotolerans]
MTGRLTSKDVAAAAGVSQSTVSLVMGGKWTGRVSPATAHTVLETAERLGYRPNRAARSLRMGSTRTLLLVVPTLANPFFAHVHAGAARAAAGHEFGVIVHQRTGYDDRESLTVPHEAIDGVLATSMEADLVAELRGIPLVMLDSEPGPAPTVNVDVEEGMRLLTGHLAVLGHRRFAHLASEVDSWTFRARGEALAGAVAAVRGATLVRRPTAISVQAARAAARALLAPAHPPGAPGGSWKRLAGRRTASADAPGRVTALVCDDDVIAAGAYKAARDLGLAVPGDLSITGFDDVLLAEALEPELTTVRLPAEELGARGVETLLELLAGGEPPAVRLPVDLVVRASTGPA